MSNEITTTRSDDNTWAVIVWALYGAAYFTVALTAIVGLIIAYLKREELAETPYASHMTSAIRTFWIPFAAWIVALALILLGFGLIMESEGQDHPGAGGVLSVIFGFLILALIVPWHIFRIVRGLIRAIDHEPIVDPMGWF